MNLSFADKNHIITFGHSAGWTPAADLGAKYDVEGIIIAGGVSFFNGHYGTLPGVFDPTGGQANTTDGHKIDDFNKKWFEWDGKFAICMGYTEMKNYSTDGTWESFVNGGGSAILRKYEGYEDTQTVEVNKVYGDFDSDSAFVPFVIIYCLCYIPIPIGLNVVRLLPSTGNDTRDLVLDMLINGLLSTVGSWSL